VSPFLQRLPSLPAGEKAAAVNLGIFPDSTGAPAYAYAAPVRTAPAAAQTTDTVRTDRLAGVDALLRGPSAPPAPQPVWQQPSLQDQPQAQPVRVAYVAPPRPTVVQRTAAVTDSKIWLQLASGRDATALSRQFDRLKSNNRDVFKGISGYVVEGSDRARLVIGPFRGPSDAEILADDLHSIGIDAFRWTNSDSDRIVPIAAE
jgi:hypothetical protein